MINFRLLRHLWLFRTVAEEQHFGRAAQKLGMTQPPLTEQIQILEQALKVKLFDRSRRGTQLTAAGRAILPAVSKFVTQMEQLELAVNEAMTGQTGMVTIGAITSAMVDVLPPLIDRLQQDYPHVTVSVREIDSAEAIPALQTGDIDLAFARLDHQTDNTIQIVPLKQDALAVALPSQHPLASQLRVALAELSQETFVMFPRPLNPPYFDTLIASCQASGFAPRILHEARTVASQVAFVGCNQGVALVPLSMQKMAPENVVIRPLTGEFHVVTTALAWNPARENPIMTHIVEMLVAEEGTAKICTV
jgi:DNA-binding transcriptional LysR family regulator